MGNIREIIKEEIVANMENRRKKQEKHHELLVNIVKIS